MAFKPDSMIETFYKPEEINGVKVSAGPIWSMLVNLMRMLSAAMTGVIVWVVKFAFVDGDVAMGLQLVATVDPRPSRPARQAGRHTGTAAPERHPPAPPPSRHARTTKSKRTDDTGHRGPRGRERGYYDTRKKHFTGSLRVCSLRDDFRTRVDHTHTDSHAVRA